MSATTKVLGTNELLEMILLKLPLRDVLLAQLVCKTWRADITASIDLQRALFFEPEISAPAPLTIVPAPSTATLLILCIVELPSPSRPGRKSRRGSPPRPP